MCDSTSPLSSDTVNRKFTEAYQEALLELTDLVETVCQQLGAVTGARLKLELERQSKLLTQVPQSEDEIEWLKWLNDLTAHRQTFLTDLEELFAKSLKQTTSASSPWPLKTKSPLSTKISLS